MDVLFYKTTWQSLLEHQFYQVAYKIVNVAVYQSHSQEEIMYFLLFLSRSLIIRYFCVYVTRSCKSMVLKTLLKGITKFQLIYSFSVFLSFPATRGLHFESRKTTFGGTGCLVGDSGTIFLGRVSQLPLEDVEMDIHYYSGGCSLRRDLYLQVAQKAPLTHIVLNRERQPKRLLALLQ